MVLEIFNLGTQWQPPQGELGLNVWFAEVSLERTDGHMNKGNFSAFRLDITHPHPQQLCIGSSYT